MVWRWSKERIVAAIRAWRKHDPLLRHVYRNDPSLHHAARRFFGSWRNAVHAAGAKPFLQRWTKQAIIGTLRTYREQGLPKAM